MKYFPKALIYLLLIAIVLLVGYNLSKSIKPRVTETVACTQDALQCPDGSYVSRTGPNCEFAQCPLVQATSTSASTTKTFFDAKQGVSFDYVDNFYIDNNLTEYIVPIQWPPQIVVSNDKLNCKAAEVKYINAKKYCVFVESEGAAGSVYTTYTYKTTVEKKTVSLTFITRFPQCANFDEPKISECKKEEKNFKVDSLAEQIFKTVKFQ